MKVLIIGFPISVNFRIKILPDHMANFSKTSSWVLESSAKSRDVWVYGKGVPRQELYFRASQVVVFLQLSFRMDSFRKPVAAWVTIKEAAQTQSIPNPPTME